MNKYVPLLSIILLTYVLATVGVVIYDLNSYIIGLAGGVTFGVIMFMAKIEEWKHESKV